jgi:hypothetical protein
MVKNGGAYKAWEDEDEQAGPANCDQFPWLATPAPAALIPRDARFRRRPVMAMRVINFRGNEAFDFKSRFGICGGNEGCTADASYRKTL